LRGNIGGTLLHAQTKEPLEGFLEYINQILMTGEVAGLFAKDELDAIVNDIRPVMKAESPGKFCGNALSLTQL